MQKKDESLNKLKEQLIQAKLDGDTKLIKMLKAIIKRIESMNSR